MLFSIIIPVYNTDKYLAECIDSILAQSFTDFELLLIDDGSTDKSGEICDNYARKDQRIRVFHKTNGGASSARNIGLDNAQGEWIGFVDSDDFVEPIYLEVLSQKANDADITFFPVKKMFENSDISLQIPSTCFLLSRDEIEERLANLKYGKLGDLFGWTHDKLFRFDIIKRYNLRFPEDVVFREDEIFTQMYCRYITSLKIIDVPLYNYRVLQNGLTAIGMLDSDYLALSNHLLENLPYYHNELMLSGDKRRIIDYRILNIWKEISTEKLSLHFSSLYAFTRSHKDLCAFSNCPRLVRLFTYPYWLSFCVIYLYALLKTIFRKKK